MFADYVIEILCQEGRLGHKIFFITVVAIFCDRQTTFFIVCNVLVVGQSIMQNLLRRNANGENAQQDKTNNTSYRPGKVHNMLQGCKLAILPGVCGESNRNFCYRLFSIGRTCCVLPF